jgi:acyl carrier protein phosphodiesterase
MYASKSDFERLESEFKAWRAFLTEHIVNVEISLVALIDRCGAVEERLDSLEQSCYNLEQKFDRLGRRFGRMGERMSESASVSHVKTTFPRILN